MRIVTVKSGVGNVRSVVAALDRATRHARSASIVTSSDPEEIRSADVLVVPGQGAFGAFVDALDAGAGLREVLVERIRAGVPYLGICLGLQVLFEDSAEAPMARGLGIFRGSVRRLVPGIDASTGLELPLPHMGWNRAEEIPDTGSIATSAFYYFAHSYAAVPVDPSVTSSVTKYGDASFASSIRSGNVFGVQFHPEKSQAAGLALLDRFFVTATRSLK